MKKKIRFNMLLCYTQWVLSSFFHKSFQMNVPSQNIPVLCILHPLSHFPVVLLQGAPSLQTPWHLTHLPFETYVPDVQTVKKQTTELIHEVNDSRWIYKNLNIYWSNGNDIWFNSTTFECVYIFFYSSINYKFYFFSLIWYCLSFAVK